MAAKKAAQTTEDLKQEVATLQQEVKELEEAQGSDAQPAVVEEEKKSLKDRAKEFGAKHPKLTKAGKAVGVAVVGVVGGILGYALGRDSIDDDLVEKLMDNNNDVDVID